MSIFFTSDTHYGHANIMRYCERPFKEVQEMDEALITNFNSVVQKTDTVYHLGDFSFRDPAKYVKRLNGHKHLILGNHDRFRDHKEAGWESIDTYKELKLNDLTVILFHYPMRSWNKSFHGSYHAFGHVHNKLPPYYRSRDVGVDAWNMFPVKLEDFVTSLQTQEIGKDTEDL